MIGIRDGVRLAQAKTVQEAEDIGAQIEADINADLHAVRAELARRKAEHDSDAPLN
jgi:Arc/MetJ-type ribon-helix-helix transcriptional regulator